MSNGRRKFKVVVGIVALVVGACAGLSLSTTESDAQLVTYIEVTPPTTAPSTSKPFTATGEPPMPEVVEPPEGSSGAVFEAWRVEHFRRLEDMAHYCGDRGYNVICDGTLCVHNVPKGSVQTQLHMYAKRPRQLLEVGMVEFLGAPPEVDRCATAVDRFFQGTTRIHGTWLQQTLCIGFMPFDNIDEAVPGQRSDDHRPRVDELCQAGTP